MKRCRWVRSHMVEYVWGRLTRDLNGALAEHLHNCPHCWQLHQDISAAAAALRRLRPSEPPPKTLLALRRRLASVQPASRAALWAMAVRRFAAVAAIVVGVMVASAPWVYVAYSTDTARLSAKLEHLRSSIVRADLLHWLASSPAALVDAKTRADARLLLEEVVNAAERGSVSQVQADLLRERVVQSNLLGRVQDLVARTSGVQQQRLRDLAAILKQLAQQ